MVRSTRKAPPTDPAGPCIPFSGLGHAMECVAAAAERLRPVWNRTQTAPPPAHMPVRVWGYALQVALGRETRAG